MLPSQESVVSARAAPHAWFGMAGVASPCLISAGPIELGMVLLGRGEEPPSP
jgi:hypothetical protein